MSNLVDFDEVLRIIREKNPFIAELFGDKKVSGTRLISGSPYKRDVADETRFVLKGGAQVSFVGGDDQEDFVKILGGKEKAQKSLDFLNEYSKRKEGLSVVSELAADILTISLEKYIKKLSSKEQNRLPKRPNLTSIEEMNNALGDIDNNGESMSKTEEKLQYLMGIKRLYKRRLDEIKIKLESLKLQISDKSIITKGTEDGGREIANMDSIQRLYDSFQNMRGTSYEYMRIIKFINDKIRSIRKGEEKPNSGDKTPDNQDEAR